MYYTQKHTAEIDIDTLLKDYIDFSQYENSCKDCPNYGTLYSCPPYDFDKKEFLQKFSKLKIIALQILFDKKLTNKFYSESEISTVYRNIITPERNSFDSDLLLEEKSINGLALYAGSCNFCQICKRKINQTCEYPDKMRYSIESLGGDVVGLSRDYLGVNILWAGKGNLPEYFLFVGGVLL
ncbi:MAG TPA: DUF2284 domain-containing protein [Clostridia bacterium]|nr:DUF2284 domain-containing protein [Clostridia bacterium]